MKPLLDGQRVCRSLVPEMVNGEVLDTIKSTVNVMQAKEKKALSFQLNDELPVLFYLCRSMRFDAKVSAV